MIPTFSSQYTQRTYKLTARGRQQIQIAALSSTKLGQNQVLCQLSQTITAPRVYLHAVSQLHRLHSGTASSPLHAGSSPLHAEENITINFPHKNRVKLGFCAFSKQHAVSIHAGTLAVNTVSSRTAQLNGLGFQTIGMACTQQSAHSMISKSLQQRAQSIQSQRSLYNHIYYNTIYDISVTT